LGFVLVRDQRIRDGARAFREALERNFIGVLYELAAGFTG
jgi:hypothetical protein